MSDNLETWTQRIAWTALIALVIGGISWASWATIELNSKLDVNDINTIAPYVKDQAWISSEIVNLKTTQTKLVDKLEGRFSQTIQDNTNAITALKEQLKYSNRLWERVLVELEQDKNKK